MTATPEAPDDLSSPIDWRTAVRVAVKAAPGGPAVSALDAALAVSELRDFSRTAELAVREVTGLGAGLPVLDGMVVDRPGWIRATTEGMAIVAEPMTKRLAKQLADKGGKGGKGGRHLRRNPTAAARTAASVPIGTVLGYLSGKVLGQYDPFVSDPAHPDHPGRLLLVAPNIVKVERELELDPRDFRLWVCLHESTHRLQFTAVPWLRDHFLSLVDEFSEVADLDADRLLGRLKVAWEARKEGGSWIEATQSPEQRAVFDKLLAFMTLLEGHADYVMDAVGPKVVPSVIEIRAAFTERRKRGAGPIDRILRSLLGMDLKLQQYVKGGSFVKAVVAEVGMDGFNAVWASPDALPTRNEIADPGAWVVRIHP